MARLGERELAMAQVGEAGYSEELAEPAARAASTTRFHVLDSWRGICALLVAVFHFPAAGAISQSPFIASAFLFVDFFFVLSGFVIASGYSARLVAPGDVRRFVFVRFGRLYPLHLTMLAAFAGFEAMRLLLPQLRGGGDAPFTGGYSLDSLVTNLFLLQGLGVENGLTWNGPSWSISSEFFAYLFFAVTVFMLGRRSWVAQLAVIAVAPAVLVAFSPKLMDATYDFGLIRCLYGFSVGALLYRFQGRQIAAERQAAAASTPLVYALWSLAELATIVAIFSFVRAAGPNAMGVAAPFVFAFAIYVFAHEGGAVSALLRNRTFLWLGSISYSIYLVHIFVQGRMYNVASLADRVAGTHLLGDILVHGQAATGFGWDSPLVGLAATLVMIALTLFAAHLTWRVVEMPALAWFRGRAKRSAIR